MARTPMETISVERIEERLDGNQENLLIRNPRKTWRLCALATYRPPRGLSRESIRATVAWAHPDSTTEVRRKRTPITELESSVNPQPGKAALREPIAELRNAQEIFERERRTRIRSTCRPPCTTSGNICNVNFSPRCWTNWAVWENGISTLSKSSVFCLCVIFFLAIAGCA